jgi:hypothetical protein
MPRPRRLLQPHVRVAPPLDRHRKGCGNQVKHPRPAPLPRCRAAAPPRCRCLKSGVRSHLEMLSAEQAAGVLRACFVDDSSVSAQVARLAPRLPAPAPAPPPRRAERAGRGGAQETRAAADLLLASSREPQRLLLHIAGSPGGAAARAKIFRTRFCFVLCEHEVWEYRRAASRAARAAAGTSDGGDSRAGERKIRAAGAVESHTSHLQRTLKAVAKNTTLGLHGA